MLLFTDRSASGGRTSAVTILEAEMAEITSISREDVEGVR